MKTNVVLSKSTNPWFNLAYEEHILKKLEDNEMVFYLWQNSKTVVIGKHQNPWSEVNVELLGQENGKLARRLSGGGAVYHDLGNVNFTFACSTDLTNLERQFKVIMEALKELGIETELSGRNDILAKGRKFSGNSFFSGNNRYIHHGTIMLNVDTSYMGRYLNISEKKIKSKAVPSVRSKVINLIDIVPKLTVEQLNEALIKSFENIYSPALSKITVNEKSVDSQVTELFNKFCDWNWIYGGTPKFDYILSECFDWGTIELNLEISNAVVKKVKICSDLLNTHFIKKLEERFIGLPFEKKNFLLVLKSIKEENKDFQDMTDDITDWLGSIQL